MDIMDYLEELQRRAKKDQELRNRILETRKMENPLSSFCTLCRELGYPIYDMDLIQAGEEFHAAMKRSTNGGGENTPMLQEQDDFYEMFFVELDRLT